VIKLLLTSSGIKNESIRSALVELLGKPISESTALFVPTGIYPFPGGGGGAYRAICGVSSSPLCELGWKSVGVLELTALTSIDRKAWVPTLEAIDALLVFGGDVLYLSYWMEKSGLNQLLASRQRDLVYIGVSAGSMAASTIFAEACTQPPSAASVEHTSEEIVMPTPDGHIRRTFVTARGAGLVDFALIAHLEAPDHPDASLANAKTWASKLPLPVYAIDDETALKVVDGKVDVVSEGRWEYFAPAR
jgi:dipeptidase E